MKSPAWKFFLLSGQQLLQESCFTSNYYGSYRDGDVFKSIVIPDSACIAAVTANFEPTPFSTHPGNQLVWLEHVSVDPSINHPTFRDPFDAFIDHLSSPEPSGQTVLSAPSQPFDILYRSSSAALLAVTPAVARKIDTVLPPFWKSTLLPESPIDFVEVSSASVQRIENIMASINYDPIIAQLVEGISAPQLQNDIRYLSGEDTKSPIVSRHSFADGSRVAAKWLKERFEENGVLCELRPFLEGFAPNVICRYQGLSNSSETVLISGHYDSRGSFGSTRAPGADDDGSGTVALLGIARAIRRSGVRFLNNVELVAFAGEEQGLLGSRAYASELRAVGADLVFAVQADMLAYRVPGEPMQLGMPDIIGTPAVMNLIANVSALYSPELVVGSTSACCSDHQSFIANGFAAAQLFERNGPIADPMYHNSGDLSNRTGYDFDQLRAIAKVQLATILHTAGYQLPQKQ